MVKEGALRSRRPLQALLLATSGAALSSPLRRTGSAPLLRGKRTLDCSLFFSPAGFEATWRWETRKMPKSNARSPEGTCWSPRRPWPGWNAPNLPNSLAVSARQSPKTPARASPAQPLAGGSDLLPRRGMQGPRSADPLPLHGPVPPFLAPLRPSAAGREPPDFAGTREDTPRREEAVSAISPNSLRALEAAEGARPAGRSRDTRGPAPTPRLPWAGRDGAILLPSHHDRDSQGGERGRGGGSTFRLRWRSSRLLRGFASFTAVIIAPYLVSWGCLRLIIPHRWHLGKEPSLLHRALGVAEAFKKDGI